MLETVATVRNPKGLHARPSARLAETAARFQSEIRFDYEGFEGSAKKILDVLSLGAECGAKITVRVDGPDEAEAMKAIKELVESDFPY